MESTEMRGSGGGEDATVRVAAVQAAPAWLDRDGSTAKAVALIAEAATGGAEMAAFGEAWLPGFPFFIWLGAPAWGAPYFRELHRNAVEIPSPTTAALCNAARDNRIGVAMGMTERDGGSLYCTLLFIDRDGEIIGRKRKLKPTHCERTVWGEGDGRDLFVMDTSRGVVGGLNCWEHLQPLSKYAMYAMGEQIHVAAWPALSIYNDEAYALGIEANMAASRTYALEGQVFVIAVTSLVDDVVYDRLCDTDERRRWLEKGGGTTTIFAPTGETIAGPLGYEEEKILYADLDLGMIRSAKAAADPAGHYARADVTQLLLNRTARPAFVEVGKDEPARDAGDERSEPDDGDRKRDDDSVASSL